MIDPDLPLRALDALLWLQSRGAMLYFVEPGRVLVVLGPGPDYRVAEGSDAVEAVDAARAGRTRAAGLVKARGAPDGAPGGRDLEALLRESVERTARRKVADELTVEAQRLEREYGLEY